MIPYIFHVILFQTLFLLVYDAFLRRETFFNWNRSYLLTTSILALVLPLIKIDRFKGVVSQQYIIQLPEVVIGNVTPLNVNQIPVETTEVQSLFTWSWEYLLYVGMLVAAVLLVYKTIKVLKLLSQSSINKADKLFIVKVKNSTVAFSFFNYVFLGDQLEEEEQESILRHEIVHVEHKHSLDLMLFEVMRIVFWFNPLVYIYQSRLMVLHEFIADATAIKYHDKKMYYQNLLSRVFDTKDISFINPFFKQSLIKKRIVMLSKSRSKQVNLLKYVLLIPLVMVMLVYTSSYSQKTSKIEVSKEDKTNQDNLKQEYNEDQLKEKFYQELLLKEKAGISMKEIADTYILDYSSDNYIYTRTDYIRFQAYKKFISEKADRFPLDAFEGLKERLLNWLPTSYAEYLELKKTDKAKKEWENNANPETIRIAVNDLNDLTKEEQSRYDEKLKLLKTNDYYKKLIETDIHGEGIEVTMNREEVGESPITEKVNAVKNQIQTQGNTNEKEDNGLKLLFEIAKGNTLNQSLVEAVQSYVSQKNKTPLTEKISDLLNQIQAQGQLSDEEEKALKNLLVLTSDSGFTDPFFDDVMQDIEVPFAVIEKVPVFPGCETLTSNEERKKCMSKNISGHVNKNFNTGIAKENGITGIQRIMTIFKINAEGNIVDIKARASHPALETETVRVISTLPKMLPGRQKGKTVTVPYSLPIVFQVQVENDPSKEKE